ncbi:hypothetical protein OC845_005283 [Tilletia horrida]|nr:hypothetical protein OC845_005283 [Tilletia horrida]
MPVAPTPSRPKPANLKVIGVGLPRTGTLSMKQALDLLGFPCHHMAAVLADRTDREAKMWAKAAWEGLSDAEWDDLLGPWQAYLYPDAKVLVTTRDANKWLASMNRTIGVRRPGDWEWFLMKYFSPALKEMVPMWAGTVWKGCFKDRKPLEPSVLTDFYDELHTFFRERGELDRVLVYDIDSKVGPFEWAKVCPFLGVPVPQGVAWPDVNASDPEKVRRMQDAAGDATRAAFGTSSSTPSSTAHGSIKNGSADPAASADQSKAQQSAADVSAGVVKTGAKEAGKAATKAPAEAKTGFESYMSGARPSPNQEVARIKRNINIGLQTIVGAAVVVTVGARAWGYYQKTQASR